LESLLSPIYITTQNGKAEVSGVIRVGAAGTQQHHKAEQ